MAEDFDFEKINKSSEKLAKTHESSIKHLIKSAETEKMKAALVKNHIKMLKEELSTNKKLKPEQIKAIEKEIKATKNATKTTREFGAKMKDAGANIAKGLFNMVKDTALAVPKTIMNFMDATSGVKDFTSATKEFAGTVLHPMHMLGKSIDFNANMFKTLSQQGAGFGKSVIDLRNAAHSANMPILDFVDLIQQNTSTFAALFGNVDSGMADLQGFTKALRDVTKTQLAEFGLNMEETTEFMMTQLELERVRGMAGKIGQDSLIARTVEYAKQLTRLSKLTGLSVKELDKQNRAAAVDGTFQATLAGMDKEQRDRTVAMSGALERINPALGQMFKEMIAFGVPITDASKQLSVLSKGAIPDLMNGFKNGMSDENFLGGLRESVNLDSPFAKALAQAGMLGANGIGDALNAAAAIIGKRSKGLDDLMGAKDKDAGTIVGAKEDLDKLLVAFQKESTGILKVALEEFKIKEMLQKFGEMADGLDGEGTIAEKSFGVLSEILAGLKEHLFGGFFDFFKGGKKAKEQIKKNQEFEKQIEVGLQEAFVEKYGEKEGQRQFDEYMREYEKNFPMHNKGTYGFENFGTGTPAMLHGSEMVIPEANASKIVKDLVSTVNTTGGTGEIADAGGNDLSRLTANTEQLIALNEKVANHLNMLVTIGAMTEKNTKNTNNNLANMSGTLV